ncbi:MULTISPECIES: site-2 protease family protein [unclassified Crossiella]|uniref:site-2 protease family protein n=1 Tax=unclassified Crossiella TaxID=2620835 RepID=UPI001FFFCAA3|nr:MULTISPECIES: site-2 protease family protein [unclassified Crossiella]MCK2243000.1 site-2 protease family protein [Crossiella sp. S99.2]MCK2256877.1 site-2 protease family protein [Crossiella sp. S99.1]
MTTLPGRRPRLRDGGLLLGRVGGVPVLLAHSWWLLAAVIVVLYTPLVEMIVPGTSLVVSAIMAGVFAVLLAASVLLHELGHVVVALRLGLPVRRVRLQLLGGAAELMRTPTKPGQEGWVAAAGPAVSVGLAALAGLGLLLVPGGGVLWLLIAQLAVANAAVAVINLLPGLPLDGGRVLRALVWAATGKRMTGTRVAVIGAGVVAAAMIWWAVMGLAGNTPDRWLRLAVCVLMAWFVVLGAGAEMANEHQRTWPAGLTLADLVRPVLQLPAESPVADALDASAGRGVVLVRADGVAAGLLDATAAARLAALSPLAPAERAAEPINAETVILDSEPGEEIIDRVRGTAAWQFLVVDEDGRPAGVLHREDLRDALRRRRG